MKQFVINEALKNGLLQYLSTQPWSEVNPAIHALNSLQEFNQNETSPKQEDKSIKSDNIDKK